MGHDYSTYEDRLEAAKDLGANLFKKYLPKNILRDITNDLLTLAGQHPAIDAWAKLQLWNNESYEMIADAATFYRGWLEQYPTIISGCSCSDKSHSGDCGCLDREKDLHEKVTEAYEKYLETRQKYESGVDAFLRSIFEEWFNSEKKTEIKDALHKQIGALMEEMGREFNKDLAELRLNGEDDAAIRAEFNAKCGEMIAKFPSQIDVEVGWAKYYFSYENWLLGGGLEDMIGVTPPPEAPECGCGPKPEEPEDPEHAPSDGSPIVMDLDGDGVETVSLEDGTYFDHDGNQFAEKTGWVGADDALLTWDRNGNGQIDDGSELFGNNFILADGSKAANGFKALAEFDSNGDGVVDRRDNHWAELKLWQDRNANGVVDANEMLTLEEAGVAGLNVNYRNQTTSPPTATTTARAVLLSATTARRALWTTSGSPSM